MLRNGLHFDRWSKYPMRWFALEVAAPMHRTVICSSWRDQFNAHPVTVMIQTHNAQSFWLSNHYMVQLLIRNILQVLFFIFFKSLQELR